MDIFVIEGGKPLKGAISVEGAKNAALPALAGALLTGERVTLENIPNVRDITTMGALMRNFGAKVDAAPPVINIEAEKISSQVAPYELVKTMRASILTLGPLLAREGNAEVSLPGGCAIGPRPVNLHLEGLRKLGADINVEHGYIHARSKKLRGAEIYFDTKTVTGTENLMMAATLAEGTTILQNCAREPEIEDLANMLISMGADIQGAGTDTIVIKGVSSLHGTRHKIIPDRIVAGTYLLIGAIAGGKIRIDGAKAKHLRILIDKLRDADLTITEKDDAIEITADKEMKACDIVTQSYPGFPTDLQAQYLALMTQANGTSVIEETIFEQRFMHIGELQRMKADIRIEGKTAIVRGRRKLEGAHIMATDLRASASLVLAGLAAEGETVIHRVYHIDRGYEKIDEKLRSLGADIARRKE